MRGDRYVLDTSAFVGVLLAEPRAERARDLLRLAVRGEAELFITAVNLGEVAYVMLRQQGRLGYRRAIAILDEQQVAVVDVDRDLALAAGRLKAGTSLGLADCMAASLARSLDAAVVTADRGFAVAERFIRIEWLG